MGTTSRASVGSAMHEPSGTYRVRRQQSVRLYLSLEQEVRNRAIRDQFLRIPAPLPHGRPREVRTTFDNAGRRHGAFTPCAELRKQLKVVAREAVASGDAGVVEQVRDRIGAFFHACAADVLAELPCPTDDLCHIEALIEETRAESGANVPQARALANPKCRATLERFLETGEIHHDRLGVALVKVRRLLSTKARTASRS